MLIQSATIYLHASKLGLIPLCRELNTPFSVIESVQIFSTNVTPAILGEAIIASLARGRDDVGSNDEGLGLDELARLFGERTSGGLDKRSGRVAIDIHLGEYNIYPWLRDGNRGRSAGKGVRLPLTTPPFELAIACIDQLHISLQHATQAT